MQIIIVELNVGFELRKVSRWDRNRHIRIKPALFLHLIQFFELIKHFPLILVLDILLVTFSLLDEARQVFSGDHLPTNLVKFEEELSEVNGV